MLDVFEYDDEVVVWEEFWGGVHGALEEVVAEEEREETAAGFGEGHVGVEGGGGGGCLEV